MPDPLSQDDQSLLDFVADRDVACPRCGYNLRALRSCACPECGETLELKVGATQPYLIAWIVTTAAMLLPGGVGALLLIVLIREGGALFAYSHAAEVVSMIAFMLALPLSVLVLVLRKLFLHCNRQTQGIFAGVSAAYCVVSFILFLTQMR